MSACNKHLALKGASLQSKLLSQTPQCQGLAKFLPNFDLPTNKYRNCAW
jgi:hypothetical protein